ncbi:MAG: 3-oxoacyl-ACP reductase [Candidatus Binatia bacterium]|nr:MAG: 3-oxoacyl-ACP reductase [Candidatus Binatia bacterium]
MAGRLENKVALVTGAAGGIGSASVRLFAREGASVVAVDLDEARGEALVREIQGSGGRAAFFRADVSRAQDARAMVEFAESTYGRLDVLFNNAGIFPAEDGSVLDTPEEVFDRVLAVNLKGVFLGCKHGIPALLRSGGGSIVNTASFVAVMGSATSQIAYTASKGAVLSLTREIAVEFARRNIRANALCPGPVRTPLLAELLRDPEARARRLVHLPMGRLAEAEEVARAALFLASDESSYVSGATFLVDGAATVAYVTPE